MTKNSFKFKSIIIFIVAIMFAALTLSIAACGKQDNPASDKTSASENSATSETGAESNSEEESSSESESESSEQPSDESFRIRWVIEDEVAEFLFDGTTPRTAKKGETIVFGLRVSPYYEGEPEVKAGDDVVPKRADGKYAFTVKGAVTVSVEGLRRADATITGLGTVKNPYKISNASQLKTFSDSINSGSEKYKEANVELTADIDLKGEKVDPIGKDTSSYFMGVFDGNGHKISNFNINSDQGIIGFFGYAVTAEIKNLTIENDMILEPSTSLASSIVNLIVGGVVAYNIGSDITNCEYIGDYSLVNGLSADKVNVFFGGICGYMQGYSDEYTASIAFCRASGNLKSVGDNALYAAGGLAGTIYGTSFASPAYIYDSVFSGELSGKILNAGGIVGYLRTRASVANCFVSGVVSASAGSENTNAGAIAGKTDNETAITRVASNATVNCAFSSDEGTQDYFGGLVYDGAYLGIDMRKSVIRNCEQVSAAAALSDIISKVGWDNADWNTADGEIVPVYDENAEKAIKAHFVFGTEVTRTGLDGNDLTLTEDVVTSSGIVPLYWIYGGSGMNTFKADNKEISYGYFFDEARTERVPSCYLITNDVDIYVGFADYSAIAGDYYLALQETKDNSTRNVEVHLEFDDNGKMTMSYDGIVASYMYVYNGETIMIKDGYFAYIQYASLASSYNLTADYYCEVSDDGNSLIVYDTVFFAKSLNRQVTANKLNAAMGVWYEADGSVYTFLSDGTGTIDYAIGGSQSMFTYSCSGNAVTIKIGTKSGYATIMSDGTLMECSSLGFTVTKTDIFSGVWESSFANQKVINFNGKGVVNYNGEEYEYEVDGGAAFFNGITAEFNDDGLLVVTENGKSTVYGREGSYIGTWTETLLNYTIQLDGINKDGYGTGRDSNNIEFTYIAEKDGDDIMVNMYYRTTFYGMFSTAIDKNNGATLLALAGYYYQSGMIVDDFNMCYYDPMTGVWNAANGVTYEFNGLGEYDIYYTTSDDQLWQAQGFVKITENGETKEVRYKYDRAAIEATFVYKDVTYTVSLVGNDISVNEIICKAPDEISTYMYHADGDVLEFNGKSAVGLGKVKVTAKDGTVTEYDYTSSTTSKNITAIVTNGGAELYKIEFKADEGDTGSKLEGRIFKNGVDVTEKSGLYHRIIGKTYLVSGEMTFYADGLFDMEGKTTGVFAGYDVDIYYIDSNYVMLMADGSFLYYVSYVDENTLALTDSAFRVEGALTVPDGLQGKYSAEDGSSLELDGRSKSTYVNAVMTLTVVEDFDGEKETVEYTYVYKQENGELFAYELDRSGDEDVLTKKYKISLTKTDGAKEFKNDERSIYLSEVTE